jgi:hypothetical protein
MLNPADRIVTQMPLERLWDDQGELTHVRGGCIGSERIRELLRSGRVMFVVADCGEKLSWIQEEDLHRYWKTVIQPHLVEPDESENGQRLETFPDEYCFIATEWREADQVPVILLEMQH